MITGTEQYAQQSPAPFLVRAMFFSTSGWERRRKVGRQRFVRRMTLLGVGTGSILVATTAFSALRAGAGVHGLTSGANLVLLIAGLMTPLVLFGVAGLEWRLLEARYELELAKVGVDRQDPS